jgi:hypothetical protein
MNSRDVVAPAQVESRRDPPLVDIAEDARPGIKERWPRLFRATTAPLQFYDLAVSTGWEYAVLTVKNPDVRTLQGRLNRHGAAGWELVSALTTVKTWVNLSGNDLVCIFKRASDSPADRMLEISEPDPLQFG